MDSLLTKYFNYKNKVLCSLTNKVNSNIFHYTKLKTTIDMFCNFCSSNIVVRHKNIYCFSDKRERDLIFIFYQNAVKKFCKDFNLSKNNEKMLLSVRADEIYIYADFNKDPAVPKLCKSTLYVACFTYNENNEFMWKNYGKDLYNASIGFNTYELSSFCSDASNNKDYRNILINVIYNGKDKFSILYNLLKETYNEYNLKETVSFIKDFLNCFRFCYKRDFFKKENEVRSVLLISDEFIEEFNNVYEEYWDYLITEECLSGSVYVNSKKDKKSFMIENNELKNYVIKFIKKDN